MTRRLTRTESGFAIAALMVALAGGAYLTTTIVSAQGPGFGGGRGGRMGGPGGGMGRLGGGGPGGPGRPGRGPGGPGPLGDLMLGRIDLTDAQRDQVKQIFDSHKDEQKTLGDRERAAHEALDTAITADPFDEGLVRGKASDLAQVQADAVVSRGRIRSEVLQILTTEQRDKMKKERAEMQQRREEMEKRRQERQDERRR